MNKVILIGNLTRDIELKFGSGSGTAIAKFNLAVSRYVKGETETDFISCVAFGKNAENLEKFCKKGSKISVCGNIKTGSYEKDGVKIYTTDVNVENVEFLSKVEQKNENFNDENNINNASDFGGIVEDFGDIPF